MERHRRAEGDLTSQLGFALAEKEAMKATLAAEVANVSESKRGAIAAYGDQVRQLQADKEATAARLEAKLRRQQEEASYERARLASTCEAMRAAQEASRQQAEETLKHYVSAKEDETQQLQRALGRAHVRQAQCKGSSRGRALNYSTTLKAQQAAVSPTSPRASPDAASPRLAADGPMPVPPATARTSGAPPARTSTTAWGAAHPTGSSYE
mmetsp:Transcript_15840/g.47626  ORF Transcript_15840/g.47626 Transcript_15840/m.47626 type:complete len:211 (+) Transcript_15840:1573-2205(+)